MYGSSILRTVRLYEHPFLPISSDDRGSTVIVSLDIQWFRLIHTMNYLRSVGVFSRLSSSTAVCATHPIESTNKHLLVTSQYHNHL